jgi:hypothetical protein
MSTQSSEIRWLHVSSLVLKLSSKTVMGDKRGPDRHGSPRTARVAKNAKRREKTKGGRECGFGGSHLVFLRALISSFLFKYSQ